ncbi:MAG: hypothetical protein R3F60_04705 [bacterium]
MHGPAARDADAVNAASLIVPFAQDEGAAPPGMDHAENYPRNKEPGPTARPSWWRPCAYAEYLGNIIAADPRADRWPYAVLLTDGGELAWRPASARRRSAARAAALQALGVRTYVVAFSVGQQDVGLLGVLARAGGTAVDDRGRPDPHPRAALPGRRSPGLRLAFNRILQDAILVEACNGVDDDRDGRADEGVLNACGGCGPAPEEACDGVDQDCDGRGGRGRAQRLRPLCGAGGDLQRGRRRLRRRGGTRRSPTPAAAAPGYSRRSATTSTTTATAASTTCPARTPPSPAPAAGSWALADPGSSAAWRASGATATASRPPTCLQRRRRRLRRRHR